MRRVLIFLLFVSLLLSAEPHSTHAQSVPPKLPADLLITLFNIFTRIDSETLQSNELYADWTEWATHMIPLSWSPGGQYLAFIKLVPGESEFKEFCFLTRFGNMISCSVDKVLTGGKAGRSLDYLVTWSSDEQRAYFVVDSGDMRNLVETDVTTGQTLRTIFQYDTQGKHRPTIYWTASLDYLAIYNAREIPSMYREPIWIGDVVLVNLLHHDTFTMPTELSELGLLSFCKQFSPLGSYLVARAFPDVEPPFPDDDQRPSFAVFDHQGNVVSTINNSRLQAMGLTWVDCPSWRPDEQAFYFLSGSYSYEDKVEAYILKYSLIDNSLSQYAQVLPPMHSFADEGWIGEVISPLVVSPDGNHIAFEYTHVYLQPGKPLNEVAVAFPAGEVIPLGERFQLNMDPIWIPPLQTNQQSN